MSRRTPPDTGRTVAFFLVAAILGLFTAALARQLRAPWSGAVVADGGGAWITVTAIHPDSPADWAGLHPGDRVPIDLVPPARAVHPGETLDIGDGKGRRVRLIPDATPLRVLAIHGGALFVAGLGWLMAGLVHTLRRRDGPLTRLLFVAHAAIGLGLLAAVPDASADLLQRGGAATTLHRAAVPLGAALLLHALVMLRRELGRRGGASWLPLAGYVVGSAGAAATVVTEGLMPAVLGAAVLHLLAVGLLASARAQEPAYTERQQLGWLLVGLVLPSLAFVGISATARLGSGEDVVHLAGDVLALSSLAVPATIAFATLKYRLLDVEALVGRALLDGLLAAPLAGAVLAVAGAVADVPAPRGPFLVLAAGALAAIVWWRLRRPLRRLAARFAWGRHVSPARLRRRVEGALLAARDPAAALTAVADALTNELDVFEARCLVESGDGRWRPYAPDGALAPVALPAGGHLLGLARVFCAPVSAADLAAGPLDDEERALLSSPAGGATSLLAPCLVEDRLVAVLQLGPGRHGVVPERTAYRALAHLAAVIGPQLEPHVRLAAMARRLEVTQDVAAAERAELLELVARDTARRLRPALSALRDRVRDGTDAEALAALERMFSGIVAAETDPRRRLIDAAPVLDEACLIVEPALQTHGVALVRQTARPAPVTSDPDRLRLLVAEMLRQSLEAVLHAPGPRQITLVASFEDGLALTLLDSGPERPTLDEPLLAAPWPFISAALMERLVRLDGGRIARGPGPAGGQQIRVWLPPP